MEMTRSLFPDLAINEHRHKNGSLTLLLYVLNIQLNKQNVMFDKSYFACGLYRCLQEVYSQWTKNSGCFFKMSLLSYPSPSQRTQFKHLWSEMFRELKC